MTTVITRTGRPVHFPDSFRTDEQGFVVPPPREDLAALVNAIQEHELLLFAQRLIRSARKHRPRYARFNVSRIELARLCLERALREPL